jgi:GT2 family glycosyltransferase
LLRVGLRPAVRWSRRRGHPRRQLVELADNLGFAAGNNAGIEVATGRYLLLLNSDARLVGSALAELVAFADAHPDVGVVGPKLRNPDGSLQRSVRGFPSVWRLATEFLYLRKLATRSRALNAFYAGNFAHDRTADVEWIKGACLLVRSEAAAAVGPMDESYFMYSEETDWCRRFHAEGWRVLFHPDAEVVHLGGQSTATSWQRMYGAQVTSHLRYLARNASNGSARRAKWLLSGALLMRATLYRVASLMGRRAARRERAALYASARSEVRDADLGAYRAADRVQRNVPIAR